MYILLTSADDVALLKGGEIVEVDTFEALNQPQSSLFALLQAYEEEKGILSEASAQDSAATGFVGSPEKGQKVSSPRPQKLGSGGSQAEPTEIISIISVKEAAAAAPSKLKSGTPPPPGGGGLTKVEERMSGKVLRTVYKKYAVASGGWCAWLGVLLMFSFYNGMLAVTNW